MGHLENDSWVALQSPGECISQNKTGNLTILRVTRYPAMFLSPTWTQLFFIVLCLPYWDMSRNFLVRGHYIKKNTSVSVSGPHDASHLTRYQFVQVKIY